MKKIIYYSIAMSYLLLAVFVSSADCSQEQVHTPHEASITANTGESLFGEVKVSMVASNPGDPDVRITSIEFWVDGENISIPDYVYNDLKNPLLGSLEIRTEAGWGKSPWLYIYFEVMNYLEDGKWSPKKIHIAYHNGALEYRAISTNSEGTTTWEKKSISELQDGVE